MVKVRKYDKQKAHEYYMKHRKLKGKRKNKPKVTGANISARKKKKRERYVAPKSASYTTIAKVGKGVKYTDDELERYKAKIGEIKQKAGKLSPEKKKALKGALNHVKEARKKRTK